MMTTPSFLSSQRQTCVNFILNFCLPIGWLALLTGMFWVGERKLYHSVYYLTLVVPTVLVLLLQPQRWQPLKSLTLLHLFALFAAYMLLSLLWSPTDASWLSMVKRPLYIALLFVAVALLDQYRPARLLLAREFAAWVAVLAAVLSVAYYVYLDEGGRLSGYGALYNPLLSAHVFGFFTVYWLTRWYQQPNWSSLVALIPLGVLLLLSGSRTPLLAVAAALLWLAALHWRQRFWLIVTASVAAVLLWQLLAPTADLLGRGLSYRPAIWAEALRQLNGHLWLGLGLDAPQVFNVAGLEEALADTHNITLSVLFEGGLLGVGLWLTMYAYALIAAWRWRQQREVLLASTLVVFGLVSGLTEGRGFFARPAEHWFLLWIPLALLAAALARQHKTQQAAQGLCIPVPPWQLHQ